MKQENKEAKPSEEESSTHVRPFFRPLFWARVLIELLWLSNKAAVFSNNRLDGFGLI